MRSVLRILGAAGVALAISGLPGVAAPAVNSWAAKACADTWQPAADSPDFWRWQAYHNLDCAIAFIDEQIGAPGAKPASEDAQVTVRREDLEKLRMMALTAKDAAQRIGH